MNTVHEARSLMFEMWIFEFQKALNEQASWALLTFQDHKSFPTQRENWRIPWADTLYLGLNMVLLVDTLDHDLNPSPCGKIPQNTIAQCNPRSQAMQRRNRHAMFPFLNVSFIHRLCRRPRQPSSSSPSSSSPSTLPSGYLDLHPSLSSSSSSSG